MRILKYFVLLILLSLVAAVVFVATQKGTYTIKKTQFIKSPRNIVYNYVSELRNWENFGSWFPKDSSSNFVFPGATSGKGAQFSWSNPNDEGTIKTIFAIENDSLAQLMNFNGTDSKISWKFKDSIGGTKVTWASKGRMSFVFKMKAVMQGGMESLIGSMFEESLANLDHTLDYEINTFKIIPNGLVVKSGTTYLQQTILSSFENESKNRRIMLSKMLFFFKKNKIAMHGKPFVIYHTYDQGKKQTRFSVCIPINQEIHTSANSDITFGKFESFKAIKVTLNGDHSHRKQAWDKASEVLKQSNFDRGTQFQLLEVLHQSMTEVKSPSKWVTHFYIPVKTAAATAPPVKSVEPVRVPVDQETSEIDI